MTVDERELRRKLDECSDLFEWMKSDMVSAESTHPEMTPAFYLRHGQWKLERNYKDREVCRAP